MEQLKLNDEILQEYMAKMKKAIENANIELAKLDVKDITLKDLIHYKSQIRETLYLSRDIAMLYPLATNYFLAVDSMEQIEQIKERMGADNEIAIEIENFNTQRIEQKINNVNTILDADYEDIVNFNDII